MRCGERAIACGVEGEELGVLAALLAEARSYCDDDAGAAAWAERARQSLPDGSGGWWRATQVSAISYLRRGAPEFEMLLAEMVEQPPPEHAIPERAMAIAYIVSECVRLLRNDLADKLFALLPAAGAESLGGRPEGCLASARAAQAFGAGHLSEALRLARSALEVVRRAGALRDVAETLGLCGYLLHELGAYDEATSCFVELVALGQRIGSPRDVAYGQLYLGLVHARQGRLDEAERSLIAAATGYQRLGSSSLQVESLAHLASVACARGDFERARETIERAQALGPIDHAPRAYLQARASIVALHTGRKMEALAQARSAYELVREQGVTEWVTIVAVSYVEGLLANGERETAGEVVSMAAAWLDQRAAKIGDPAERLSFLTRVPEHARVRELLGSI
jgi:eukaryotic-like serine/threonine-protein kinase